MGKTGGGPGNNQHGPKGVSGAGRRQPDTEATLPAVLALQLPPGPPVGPQRGVRGPTWPAVAASWMDFSDELAHIKPKGVERAQHRFRQRLASRLFNDARLEGNTFTEPEIITLLEGEHVAGHTEGETLQISDLKSTSDYLLEMTSAGPVQISQQLMDEVHVRVALHTYGPSLAFRADQREAYDGPLVHLGGGDYYQAPDAHLVGPLFDHYVNRVASVSHPVAMACIWSAVATYNQFYFDGNKRTARYASNALLMSRGYDAIMVPAAMRTEYEDVLVNSYKTGDLTEHARFLAGLYAD